MEQSLSSTTALLAATPGALDALLRSLPEELAQRNEGEGTWTVAQVLAHLIHGEQTDWMPRVQMILRAGETETFAPFERGAHLSDTRGVPELLDAFGRLRAASLAALEALALTAQDLERCGMHPAFGRVTLAQLLATWGAHDLTHLHQVSRILASQFREAVGPWSAYLGVLQCKGHSSGG